MIYAGKYDLAANRWVPLSFTFEFDTGIDMSAATADMQVRAYPDAQGAALLSSPGDIDLTFSLNGDGNYELLVEIDESVIEALIAPPAGYGDCNNDVTLYYDIVITEGTEGKSRWVEGKFIILAGATQNV